MYICMYVSISYVYLRSSIHSFIDNGATQSEGINTTVELIEEVWVTY